MSVGESNLLRLISARMEDRAKPGVIYLCGSKQSQDVVDRVGDFRRYGTEDCNNAIPDLRILERAVGGATSGV